MLQTNGSLEEVMDIVERGGKFLAWRDSRLWNIPLILISNNRSGKTKSKKMVSPRLLLEEEDVVMVAWI